MGLCCCLQPGRQAGRPRRGLDAAIRLWNAATGDPVAELLGHTGVVWGLGFSPDGTLVATSGAGEGSVRLWGPQTGELVAGPLPGERGNIWQLAFGPDGRRVAATNSSERAFRVWDVETRETLPAGHAHTQNPSCRSPVDFSPDGTLLATLGGRFWQVALRDAETGEVLQTLAAEGRENTISGLAFSPDGRSLAPCDEAGAIMVWEIAAGGPPRLLKVDRRSMDVALTPDGERLLDLSLDGTIGVRRTKTGELISSLSCGSASEEGRPIPPDGDTVAVSTRDCTVELWSLAQGRLRARLVVLACRDNSQNDWLALTPEGYFDGTADAMGVVTWRVGNEV